MRRNVKKVVTGTTQYDGAGVKLVRVIGNTTVKEFDPFLMLDAFDSYDPQDYIKGFPWHPHRGIETVTYLIKGNIEHGDSLGNQGSIKSGCCQWMTAGSGIMHQEMPKEADRMQGIQLWLNLPKKNKMAPPEYRDIKESMIPKIEEEHAKVRIISGAYKDVQSAFLGDYVKTLFLDVSVQSKEEWTLSVNNEDTLFVYIVEGDGYFGDSLSEHFEERRALLFNEGDEFSVKAGPFGIRFFLFSAKALKEEIAWGGPIVMNTQEELEAAFRDLKNGTFLKTQNAK